MDAAENPVWAALRTVARDLPPELAERVTAWVRAEKSGWVLVRVDDEKRATDVELIEDPFPER